MTTPAAEAIASALAAARGFRGQGRLDLAGSALADVAPQATFLPTDHPLRHVWIWRRAKIAHDQQRPEAALAFLTPLLDTEDGPFPHYPAGLAACAPLATAFWDGSGYADPRIHQLWTHAIAAHTVRGDRYAAHHAQIQLGWDRGCAGDLIGVAALIEALGGLIHADLADGPTRHPRAADAATSVPWLQLDGARVGLRAATWARDPHLADAAEDLFESAADDAGIDRLAEYWFLEPIALARCRLGRRDPDDYVGRWLTGDLDVPVGRAERIAFHTTLRRAEFARRGDRPGDARGAFAEAARIARQGSLGPEWEVDARIEGVRISGAPDPTLWDRIAAHRLHVFDRSVDQIRSDTSTK